jgi:hypothetical protein
MLKYNVLSAFIMHSSALTDIFSGAAAIHKKTCVSSRKFIAFSQPELIAQRIVKVVGYSNLSFESAKHPGALRLFLFLTMENKNNISTPGGNGFDFSFYGTRICTDKYRLNYLVAWGQSDTLKNIE